MERVSLGLEAPGPRTPGRQGSPSTLGQPAAPDEPIWLAEARSATSGESEGGMPSSLRKKETSCDLYELLYMRLFRADFLDDFHHTIFSVACSAFFLLFLYRSKK